MIITNMCIVSPSQAPGRTLSCQLTSVKSISTHQRGSRGGTYKEKESAPSALSQWSSLPSRRIGRDWEGVAFSKPRNCPLEPFLQSNGALLILHAHNQKGAFEGVFQEQNDFLENDLLSSQLEIQAFGNSIAASLAKMKIIKFSTLIRMQRARHYYQ